MKSHIYTFFAGLLLLSPLLGQTRSSMDLIVRDEKTVPISAVTVQVSGPSPLSGQTDELGRVTFGDLQPGRYQITASKAGYQKLEKKDTEVTAGRLSLEFTLIPEITRADSVEVRGTMVEVDQSASKPNTLPPDKAKELPTRPATVADVLPLTPGVIREPGGGLILSSAPESRSALIVNNADVTDPATGQFGETVPIDSVEVLSVYQTAYLAEYGRFTSGLVSVDTRRGGDKWKWELNDPLPEFRIRSWRLRGLKTATPRLNFEGPLIANKLFVSEGFEFEVRKTAVYTLPFPFNQKKQQGLNSFTQLDWVASEKHLLTATFHVAPQRFSSLNLDYFNPQQVSPDERTRNDTGTVTDRYELWHGLWENRFSVTAFDSSVWGRGTNDLVIAPGGNSGSYFAEQTRGASRVSGNSSYAFSPLEALGKHQFKIGLYVAGSGHSGDIQERPIDIVDATGHLLENIQFPRIRTFDVGDTEKSVFGQDHWILTPRLAIDLGVRTESQQISGATRVAPRFGASWSPFASGGPVIRGGYGLFYDRVPLNVYAFNRYPNRVVTYYDPDGSISGGPYLFSNTLGQNQVRRPFISQQPIDGNFSPQSIVWSSQVEQSFGKLLKLRATFLRNDADGLVILTTTPPDPATKMGAYLLQGSGISHYRQFDLTAQVRLRDDRELFFSYVRSKARGDLNDAGKYLGSVPAPVIRDNVYGTLSTDLPNRFLLWGVVRLPLKFQIAPLVEYRNGFPYIVVDKFQQYVGVPNSTRYPNFFSLDSRFSKDLKVSAKYSIRVSVSSFNLTNHFNPEVVHNNIDDPLSGYFFGHRGRRFTADFDFLF